MGITGVLPLMKPAIRKVNLAHLKGTVAAVDTNGWIHKACFFCGDKIYMNEETDRYIRFVIDFCNLLRSNEITPLLVFDGQALPAKSETKLARQKRKQAVRDEIAILLRQGKEREARGKMRTCVDVTFEMVKRVIDACRLQAIDYILAPFEADAQIVYLVETGIADYAITEDSDLLVFGCPRTLYKLDKEASVGQMLELSKLDKCFKKFNLRKFQLMCILSGCDYLTNVPGIAITRARKYFESMGDGQIDDDLLKTDRDYVARLLRKVPSSLKLKTTVPEAYIDGFIQALNTFDHQIVYCPMSQKLRHLHPLKAGTLQQPITDYAGHFFQDRDHQVDGSSDLSFVDHYALGNVHPKTSAIIDTWPGPEDGARRWFQSIVAKRIEASASKIVIDEKSVVQMVEDEVILIKNAPTTVKDDQKMVQRVYSERASISSQSGSSQASSETENKANTDDYSHCFNPYAKRKEIWNQTKTGEDGGGGKISKYFNQRKRKFDDISMTTTKTSDDSTTVANIKHLSIHNR